MRRAKRGLDGSELRAQLSSDLGREQARGAIDRRRRRFRQVGSLGVNELPL